MLLISKKYICISPLPAPQQSQAIWVITDDLLPQNDRGKVLTQHWKRNWWERECGSYRIDASYQSNIICHYNKWAIIGIVLSITWICNWLLGMMTPWFNHFARLGYHFWLPTDWYDVISSIYIYNIWMCVDTHTQQACLKHNYLKMILVKQSIDSIAIIMITAQVAGNNLYTYIYIQVYMYTHLHIHMHIYNIYTLTSTSWWGSEMRLMNNESLMALMAVTSVVLTGCMHHIHTCLCFDVCMYIFMLSYVFYTE